MTPQEMFNKAYIGVVTQGGPSIDKDENKCMYRGKGGAKCGIGHLIDDETANTWDSQLLSSIGSIVLEDNVFVPKFIKENIDLAVKIQQAHDTATVYSNFTKGYKREMSEVSKKFNLTTPVMG